MWQFDHYLDYLLHGFNRNTQALITILIAAGIGIVLRFILYFILRFYHWGTNHLLSRLLLRHMRGILLILLPVFFILLFMPVIEMRHNPKLFVQRSFQIIFILTFAWFIIRLLYVFQGLIFHKYDIEKPNNIRERKIRTQILFLRKLLTIVIFILSIALVFTRFEGMRRLGNGILTSAGILSIIAGLAAQRSLANLLAGLQIAFTQPIRIDDVVIVEGEWGRIEEITLTYVVVRIWDLRRMILPITYFIDKPFQNWTRNTADLLGTVIIYADYTIPVPAVRQEMERLVHGSEYWDKLVCELQVTDANDKTVQLRCLVSAQNSGQLFDLRCMLREKLIEFIQKNYPQSLPRYRTDVNTMPPPPNNGEINFPA